MEKYNKQSGVFKVNNYDNMLAFVGGDKEHLSEISIGILDVDIDGIKETGLNFVKCNKPTNVNEVIENFEETIDKKQQSFIYVPHTKKSIDFLIEYLNYLKKQF